MFLSNRNLILALTSIFCVSLSVFTEGYRKCSLQKWTPISINSSDSKILMYQRNAWEIIKNARPLPRYSYYILIHGAQEAPSDFDTSSRRTHMETHSIKCTRGGEAMNSATAVGMERKENMVL